MGRCGKDTIEVYSLVSLKIWSLFSAASQTKQLQIGQFYRGIGLLLHFEGLWYNRCGWSPWQWHRRPMSGRLWWWTSPDFSAGSPSARQLRPSSQSVCDFKALFPHWWFAAGYTCQLGHIFRQCQRSFYCCAAENEDQKEQQHSSRCQIFLQCR